MASRVHRLPAAPTLELDGPTILPPRMVKAVVVDTNQPSGNVFRLPDKYQNTDLMRPADPPASLGQFWPKADAR